MLFPTRADERFGVSGQVSEFGGLCGKHLSADGTMLMFSTFDEVKATLSRLCMGSGLQQFSRFFHWMKTTAFPSARNKCPNASCEALLYLRKKLKKANGEKDPGNFTSWEKNPYRWRFLDRHEMPGCSEAERVKMTKEGGLEVVVRPEQKPFRYLMLLILMFTQIGDLVVDPFMGVGSTAVACLLTGRRFWGCDKDPQAVHCARVRLKGLKDQLRAGNCSLKPAYTWDMFKAKYFESAPETIMNEDKKVFAAEKDIEKSGMKDEELLPSVDVKTQEEVVGRLREHVRARVAEADQGDPMSEGKSPEESV